MKKIGLLLIVGHLSFLMACGETAEEIDEIGDEDSAIREAMFEEKRDGKADGGQTCSGVIVPDREGFDKRVALTFDDGPSAATTPKVLDILAAQGIKATFFINGSRVKGDVERAIVKRIVDEGHILASHSQDHKDLKTVTAAALEAQIKKTHDVLLGAGVEDLYFRFPFGSSNCTTAQRVRDFGYKITGWHIDSADWCFASGTGGVGHCSTRTFRHVPDIFRSDMVGFTMSQVRSNNGGILLFHDIHQNTVNNVLPIIEKLKAEGFTFANIDDKDTFPLLNGVEPEPVPFVGDACQSDEGCNFASGDDIGDCFSFSVDGSEEAFGFCTIKCEGFCPDRTGKAATFCASLDGGLSGSCLSKSGDANLDCGLIPGTSPTEVERFIGASNAPFSSALVCFPK